MEDPKRHGGVTGPQAILLQLAYGAQAAQVIYVAAKLGLADPLKDGARSSADLAAAAGVDAAILRRVLLSLASLGVLAEIAPDRFGLTEMGQGLRSDRPDSLQPRASPNHAAASMCSPWSWQVGPRVRMESASLASPTVL